MIVDNGRTIGVYDDLDYVNGQPFKNTFGYIPSERDDRDHTYYMHREPVDIPSKFELEVTSVRDQERTPFCAGFAGANNNEVNMMMVYGSDIILSPTFLYGQAKRIDGDNVLGTRPRSINKVMQKIGICEEKLMPFKNTEDAINGLTPEVTEDMLENASMYKIDAYASQLTLEETKQAIFEQGSVQAGFQVFDTFMYAKSGYVGKIGGGYHGGHLVDFIGYDDNHIRVIDGVKYKGFLKFKNSWGKDWGDDGYGYLAYALFDHITHDNLWKLLTETATTIIKSDRKKYPNYHINKWKNKGNTVTPEKNPSIIMKVGSREAFANGVGITSNKAPKIIDGNTLVPLRFVSENMGLLVSYYNRTKRIRIRRPYGKNVELTLGSKTALIDGNKVVMRVEPIVEDGITLVPIRFISETFNSTVHYEHETKTIKIYE